MTLEQLTLLIQLTSIRSDGVIAALRSHFVDGLTQREAAIMHGVHEGLFSRRIKALKEVEATVRKLTVFYQKG